jgi:hypothetical protein
MLVPCCSHAHVYFHGFDGPICFFLRCVTIFMCSFVASDTSGLVVKHIDGKTAPVTDQEGP